MLCYAEGMREGVVDHRSDGKEVEKKEGEEKFQRKTDHL